MPLKLRDELLWTDRGIDGVGFAMSDPNGRRKMCEIRRDALEELLHRFPRPLKHFLVRRELKKRTLFDDEAFWLHVEFQVYERDIVKLASLKYDRREFGPPFVPDIVNGWSNEFLRAGHPVVIIARDDILKLANH